MTIYTVVAYRPSGYSSRHEEYYESAFDIQLFEDVESTIKELLKYKILIKECREYTDDEWEIKLLIDGRDSDFWYADFHDWETNTFKEENPFNPIEDTVNIRFSEWLAKAKEREEEAKKKKLAQEEAARKATERRQIEQEKALLKTLQEKYGS